MLKSINKLSKKDIKSLKNKKYTNNKGVFFNSAIYKTESKNISKVCVIIAKKNIKKANKRNLLRRKIYFVYNNLPQENKKKEINIIYINKNTKEEDLNKLSFLELKQEIENILK